MAAYAPLLVNTNSRGWPTNLIVFDNHRCGTACLTPALVSDQLFLLRCTAHDARQSLSSQLSECLNHVSRVLQGIRDTLVPCAAAVRAAPGQLDCGDSGDSSAAAATGGSICDMHLQRLCSCRCQGALSAVLWNWLSVDLRFQMNHLFDSHAWHSLC